MKFKINQIKKKIDQRDWNPFFVIWPRVIGDYRITFEWVERRLNLKGKHETWEYRFIPEFANGGYTMRYHQRHIYWIDGPLATQHKVKKYPEAAPKYGELVHVWDKNPNGTCTYRGAARYNAYGFSPFLYDEYGHSKRSFEPVIFFSHIYDDIKADKSRIELV